MEKAKVLTLIEMGATMRVLYVEDNESVRETTSAILKKFFPTLLIATDGEEGLALFEKYPLDLVITDINMPKKSGLEMAQQIRKSDVDLEIMIISAHNELNFLSTSETLGITRYIYKPIDLNVLMEILYEVILEITQKKSSYESL